MGKKARRKRDIRSDTIHGEALEVSLDHVVVERAAQQVKDNAQVLPEVEVVALVDLCVCVCGGFLGGWLVSRLFWWYL